VTGTGARQIPTIDRQMTSHVGRTEVLEKQVRPLEVENKPTQPIFSHPSTLTVSESGPWPYREAGKIIRMDVCLGTAGTSTTTVRALRDGSVMATVSLTTGVTSASDGTQWTLTDEQFLTVEITEVGTDAADLTVGFVKEHRT
jgi:hypothetical protein